MGSLAINLAEKKLLHHLRRGGHPDDDVGKTLVAAFADKVYSEESVAPILRRYGISRDTTAIIYGTVLKDLMPEPWMNVSGPMLVPTQWFMEPHRLEQLLMEAAVAQNPGSQPIDSILALAIPLAHATRTAHDEAYGKPRIMVGANGEKKAGCATAISFAFLAGTALLYLT